MNFDLNDDQLMLKRTIDSVLADNYDLHKRQTYQERPHSFADHVWKTLAELGILALPFSEELGGLGGSLSDIAVVMESLGESLATEPFLENILLGATLLSKSSNSEVVQEYLGSAIQGEIRIAYAHAETAARYSDTIISTYLQNENGTQTISGQKTNVLYATNANLLIVRVKNNYTTEPTLVLVDAQDSSISTLDYRLMDGSPATEVSFTNTPILADLKINEQHYQEVISQAKLAACAAILGCMSKTFSDTLEYVKTRTQFGANIGSFQAIQHRMADLYVSLEQSRSMLYHAIVHAGDLGSCSAHTAAAKAYISERSILMGEACIQLHGGIGVTDELLIGHAHKRILVLSHFFGDSDCELSRYIALAS